MDITSSEQLSNEIIKLAARKMELEDDLKSDFKTFYQNLNPVMLIKDTIQQVTTMPAVKDNLLNFSIGIGAGIATKKILVGKTNTLAKKLFGSIIETGATYLAASNADFIKSKGMGLLHYFFDKKREATRHYENKLL